MRVAFWTGVEEKGRMAGRNAACAAARAAIERTGLVSGWRRVCRIAGAARCRSIVPAMVCGLVVAGVLRRAVVSRGTGHCSRQNVRLKPSMGWGLNPG